MTAYLLGSYEGLQTAGSGVGRHTRQRLETVVFGRLLTKNVSQTCLFLDALLDRFGVSALSARDVYRCNHHEFGHRPPHPENDVWQDAQALGELYARNRRTRHSQSRRCWQARAGQIPGAGGSVGLAEGVIFLADAVVC